MVVLRKKYLNSLVEIEINKKRKIYVTVVRYAILAKCFSMSF